MTTFPRRLRHLQQLAGMLLALLVDALRHRGWAELVERAVRAVG